MQMLLIMNRDDQIGELLRKIGVDTGQLQNAKLGPGVVGRNSSIAWACEVVMLAGVAGACFMKSIPLLAFCLIGAVVVALVISTLNVRFGNQNPAAALMEGAHFLKFQQLQMAAKGIPVIEASEPGIPPEANKQLPGEGSSE